VAEGERPPITGIRIVDPRMKDYVQDEAVKAHRSVSSHIVWIIEQHRLHERELEPLKPLEPRGKRKPGGKRPPITGIRLDPRMKGYIKGAALKARRSVSSHIVWIIEQRMLRELVIEPQPPRGKRKT
jgi:hypothetical protein